ncbi:hypothetical protein [Maricaulis sp.]|uniref:hypothetical protein n=1 Tax=Maricaulis sp. TaxID=1486257 RepID=UPI002625871E|nr:hypothetical protein [Maricaulis sp.]
MLRFLTGLAALTLLAAPAAMADDEADIIAAMDEVYAVISGPVGEARDFDHMRTLFLPNASMGAVGPGPDGNGRGRVITLEDYIERNGSWLSDNGFTETATRNQVEVFGEIAYLRSAYEGYNGATGELILTGVNFVTFFKIEGEWKVASLLWRQQSDDWPVEAAFD